MQRKLKCFHWKILIQTLPECSLFNMQYKITGLIFFAFSLQSIKYIQSWWKKNKKNYLQSGVFCHFGWIVPQLFDSQDLNVNSLL